MIDHHFHWEFVAYDDDDFVDGKMLRGVVIEVVGYLSEADARTAANDIVIRQHYSLRGVRECSACGYQRQTADTLREMASKA